MPTNFRVQVLSKISFQDIKGTPYCVWSYQLSWDHSSNEIKPRVGLVLPSRLDIKVPSDYPALHVIQNTHIIKIPAEDRQFIFQDIDPAATSQLVLAFLGPCAEDSFTPVQCGTAIPEAGSWQNLPFRANDKDPAGLTQSMRGPAFICPPTAAAGPAPKLDNSSRRVDKATLVSLRLDPPPDDNGGALLKFGFLRQLGLQPGEVDAVRDPLHSTLKDLLKSFEGAPIPSQLPSPALFATIPAATLKAFGQSVVALRRRVHNEATTKAGSSSTTLMLAPQPAAALNAINAATVALNSFEANFSVTPIGMLNLERIEMTPVGIERGGLIATIPLAPLEKTAVVHKEWSVTSKEFTSIVTDSLENYSETGVTENTELAQSTQSQTSHSNQFNVNGTVTGSYGPVTVSVSSGFTAQDQNSQSANESRKHAITTTRKASSRVKQEHKVTISTTTVTGTSETSTRMLENSSSTDPIRIDYFSIMRKWHVGLYRYGLRLTYDIAIPEPGAAMRKIYADIEALKKQIGPFTFNVPFSEITTDIWQGETEPHYLVLAQRYAAQVPPPPDTPGPTLTPNGPVTGLDDGTGWHFFPLNFSVPDGCWITNVTVDAHIGIGDNYGANAFGVEHVYYKHDGRQDLTLHQPADLPDGFLKHETGNQAVTFFFQWCNVAWVGMTITTEPTEAAKQQWRTAVWNALYNAAQTQYFVNQQNIQAEIAALEDEISNVDTLTLRREENEEIMKGVLRWLLGPSFDFMPDDVKQMFSSQQNMDLEHGTTFDSEIGDGLNVTAAGWFPMFMYQEMVKFINEAIEWENVLYFLYSYFWDVPQSWPFIRRIKHPDSTRQAFLRAGSARVVLTVRKGWESAWVQFVEAGGFGQTLLPGHPYMTVAAEIQAYDMTNYPGIPPANPGGGPLPDDGESVASVSSDTLSPSAGLPVTITVKSSAGFIVGYTAIIDTYDSKMVQGGKTVTVQESQTITAVPDATHITVERIENPHNGSQKPFPVMQAGEKGQLIAEWFEYTPTSGTDIAVTSNLATIS